ncbi:MAG: hypothetical protein JEZ08_00955 [Clostridiales bacterium]|nr:hypothetical protein [Clostridiales bacterium]
MSLIGCTNQDEIGPTKDNLALLTQRIKQLEDTTIELLERNSDLENSLNESRERINLLEIDLEEQTRQITYRVGAWELTELENDRTYKDTLMDRILIHELNSKTIYGYVIEMENDRIVIDKVQRIFPEDVEMITQLDLDIDEDFFQRGYYTYNKEELTTSYKIESFTDFFHFDGQNWFLVPTEKDEFKKRMVGSKNLCQILLINGRVYRIEADSRL